MTSPIPLLFFSLLICFLHGRPDPSTRTFVSPAVDSELDSLTSKMKDQELASLTNNCLPNTLDTTIYYYSFPSFTLPPPVLDSSSQSHLQYSPSKGFFPSEKRYVYTDSTKEDTFIITGDITALWLRDSVNQIQPYLRYMSQDPNLQLLIKGLLNRHVSSILLDPYANAFNFDGEGSGGDHQEDRTSKPSFLGSRMNAMNSRIWERKYEIDSLCAVLKLSYDYYNWTKDKSAFDSEWFSSVSLIYSTMREQQKDWEEERNNPSGPVYQFQRETTEPSDSLMHATGSPTKRTGLVKSGFRPSDDSTLFSYNIPGNAMAVVNLRRVSDVIDKVNRNVNQTWNDLRDNLRALADEIDSAIQTWGIINHPTYGKIYAYEVDGHGNFYVADDANIPSLLSLPYLGYLSSNDSVYLNTKSVILSEANPWYFKGSAGEGIGGPHNGVGWIWPMSIIMRGLTTDDDEEIQYCLEMIKSSSAGTGYMHESYWHDSYGSFTRSWFAWANSLLGQLVLRLADEKPWLIF